MRQSQQQGDTMETITKQDFINLLKNNPQATFSNLVVEKQHSLKKSAPYLVSKRTKVFSNLNNNYQNKVRKHYEPGFKAQKRVWGEKITNSLVFYKGNYYVQILNPEKQEEFFSNGKEIDRESFSQYEYKKSSKENRPEVATYKIKDIKFANLLGKQYKIVG